jgi:hypothetical protein
MKRQDSSLDAGSDAGSREFELGSRALRDARQLGTSAEGVDTAVLLCRAAIRLLVRAALLRRAPGTNDTTRNETWSRATQLPAWSAFVGSHDAKDTSWLNDVVANDDGDVCLAQLSASERERVLTAMLVLARDLAAPLAEDAARARRPRRTRRIRAIVAFLVLVAIVWLVVRGTARPNLALHRPVVVSDRDPMYGVDPSQVVDGDQLNLGFHTSGIPNTTLTIDLGSVKPLRRVEVYNRSDCCQDRIAPLTVQVSADASDYRTVARRTRVFQHWTVPLPEETSARFVRLVHEGSDPFHLSEVEVY